MSEPRTDPVWLDDVESPRGHAAPRRLCIISGDALPSVEFIAALQTAVGPNEEIEIVRDRRRGGSAPAPGRPGEDRRRLSNVDTLMKLDGFAIVPASATAPRRGRAPESSFADRPIERPRVERAEERPRFERATIDDTADADERELQRILQFKRRARRLGPLWLVIALVAVLAAVLLVRLPAVKTLMSRPSAPPPAEQASAPPPAPQASSPVEPPPLPRDRATRPDGAPRPDTASRPDGGSRPDGAARAPALAERNEPERAPERAVPPRRQTDAAPRPETDAAADLPPASSRRVSSRSDTGGRPPELLRAESRFAGVPRVELARRPVPTTEGRAETYAVRVSDPAGGPLAGAEVLLLADMADGTVESVMLSAGPEPGTYVGTSRPGRSAPVDFRVRMTTSDRRFEVPLRP